MEPKNLLLRKTYQWAGWLPEALLWWARPSARSPVKALRQPKKTMLKTSGLYSHEELGAIERMHAVIEGQILAIREQHEGDDGSNYSPGQILLTWSGRHAGWSVTRFMPRPPESARNCRTPSEKRPASAEGRRMVRKALASSPVANSVPVRYTD